LASVELAAFAHLGARNAPHRRHCEERSDEAIQSRRCAAAWLDCFAALAMTFAKSSMAGAFRFLGRGC
jgi:hypothetical protein